MKTINIHIRVDEALRDEIKEEARKLGQTVSSYIILLHKQHIVK